VRKLRHNAAVSLITIILFFELSIIEEIGEDNLKLTFEKIRMNEGGFSVRVKEDEKELCAWQTDTFEIDYYDSDHNQQHPHTILMFVPGNPGCAGWYIAMLKTVVERLGRGYACRAASYAGHGTVSHLVTAKDDKGKKLAWSVDGQVEHKIEWIDLVTRECMSIGTEERQESARALPRFIFISHSIGAHLSGTKIMCPEGNILLRTDAIIHFMPFTRFDPMPMWKETFLSTLANIPGLIIPTFQMGSRFASKMPQRFVDGFLEHIAGMSLLEDRELARELFTNDEYVENHLQLGLEEIRHIPENHDVSLN
jgi:hypothetical protein